jgi:tetratricopeptide (TPR) repeat protein
VLAQHGQIDTFGFSLPLRFENALVSYTIYLRQLIWPVDLAVLYPHPETFFPFLIIAGCAALLIAFSAIAIIYRKRFPFLFTGWLWFIGMLVPVIGIVQVGRQGHADRYTYLPLIGITIAIAWLIADLTARWRFRKQIGALASAVVIIALSACAYHQTTFWRNADSLWPHTLAVTTNNDGAHLAFATSLFAEGKTEEAIAHAHAAAEIRPANAGVYGEVPVGLEGKTLDEAILFWSARVETEPNNIGARNTFGVLLVQKHQTRAAIAQWETALALNPNDGNAQSNLAWVFATAPDPSLRHGARAVELAERALKLAGGINPILYRTLAAAYAGMISGLGAASAPTNKTIPNVKRMTYKLSLSQLDNLTAAKYVTIRQREAGSVVTSGVTCAFTNSYYSRLSTVRIMGTVIDTIVNASEPFIGEPNTIIQRNTLHTAIKSSLDALMAVGIINNYKFQLFSSAQDMVNGLINVDIEIVPAFELRKIKTTITLKTNI